MGNGGQSGDQLVPQRGYLDSVLVDMVAGLLQRRRHGHDTGDILRAGPLAALLRAALDDVGQGNPLTGVQQTHALGAVELVGGQGQHIDMLGLHVNVKMARRLHRVGVEQHALFLTHSADLRNRHDGTDLVVGVHDGHKAGVLPDGIRHLLRRNGAGGAYIQQLHLIALVFQLFQRMQHGVMLKSCGNDVLLPFPRADAGSGNNGLIVGLAAAGGKGDLTGLAAKTGRGGLPGLLQRFRRLLAHGVQAGGISVIGFHIRQHRVDGRSAHFRRGRVICINQHSVPPVIYSLISIFLFS